MPKFGVVIATKDTKSLAKKLVTKGGIIIYKDKIIKKLMKQNQSKGE